MKMLGLQATLRSLVFLVCAGALATGARTEGGSVLPLGQHWTKAKYILMAIRVLFTAEFANYGHSNRLVPVSETIRYNNILCPDLSQRAPRTIPKHMNRIFPGH